MNTTSTTHGFTIILVDQDFDSIKAMLKQIGVPSKILIADREVAKAELVPAPYIAFDPFIEGHKRWISQENRVVPGDNKPRKGDRLILVGWKP